MFVEVYIGVEQRLNYHKTDTEQLILMYHIERLQEQLITESTPYGVLTVRAYFHHDSLCVEVLNARDVIPLDPNGTNSTSSANMHVTWDLTVNVELMGAAVKPVNLKQMLVMRK